MSDWQSVCIGDIATIPKKQPIANPQAIELLTVRLYAKGVERTGKYPRATERGRPYFARDAGEILIGRQNFHNGGIGIVGKADHGLICSNAITSLIPTNRADKNFLFYLLSSSEFRKSIQKQSEGTGQSEISETKILSLELALPPLPEQKKIAEILSGVEARVGTTQNQERYCSQLLEALSRDCLSREAEEIKTLGELAEFKSGRAFKSGELSEEGMKVTRISNLHKPDFPYWRYSGEYSPKIVAKEGDILFSWAGVANSINVHRYKGEDTLLNQHIYNFEFDDPLLKEWTYWNLRNLLPKLRENIEGGAGQLHLTKGYIQSLPVPIFDRCLMQSLCQCFQLLQSVIDSQKKVLAKLDILKYALSSDLLSGRKRVSI